MFSRDFSRFWVLPHRGWGEVSQKKFHSLTGVCFPVTIPLFKLLVTLFLSLMHVPKHCSAYVSGHHRTIDMDKSSLMSTMSFAITVIFQGIWSVSSFSVTSIPRLLTGSYFSDRGHPDNDSEYAKCKGVLGQSSTPL
jgi:hypothetical protein